MNEKQESPSPEELVKIVASAIDDEPEYTHLIPVSSAVGLLWADEIYRIPLVCMFAKKLTQKQIEGEEHEKTHDLFVNHLQLKEDFIAFCGQMGYLASQIAADVSDETCTFEEGVSLLSEQLTPNQELAEPLLKSMLDLLEELAAGYTPFEFDRSAIAEEASTTDTQLELHRQLAERVFGDPDNELLSFSLAIAQDYVDGDTKENLMDQVGAELGPRGKQMVEHIVTLVDSPEGAWEVAVNEMRKLSQ